MDKMGLLSGFSCLPLIEATGRDNAAFILNQTFISWLFISVPILFRAKGFGFRLGKMAKKEYN